MKRSVELPFINVRDLVLFPKMTQDLYIGRHKTIEAIQYALKHSRRRILVLAQKKTEANDPMDLGEMYTVGTVCSVEGSVLLRDRTMKAQLLGERLFRVNHIFDKDGVRLGRGFYIKNTTKGKILNEEEKTRILELIVRAKPLAAFDDEAEWFSKLKNVKRADQLSEIIQINLNYRTSCRTPGKKRGVKSLSPTAKARLISSKVRLQQQILEAVTPEKKLNFLQEYLKVEAREAAEAL